MANHVSTRTTQRYDYRRDEVSVDQVGASTSEPLLRAARVPLTNRNN
jgi:hypothetical protein